MSSGVIFPGNGLIKGHSAFACCIIPHIETDAEATCVIAIARLDWDIYGTILSFDSEGDGVAIGAVFINEVCYLVIVNDFNAVDFGDKIT